MTIVSVNSLTGQKLDFEFDKCPSNDLVLKGKILDSLQIPIQEQDLFRIKKNEYILVPKLSGGKIGAIFGAMGKVGKLAGKVGKAGKLLKKGKGKGKGKGRRKGRKKTKKKRKVKKKKKKDDDEDEQSSSSSSSESDSSVSSRSSRGSSTNSETSSSSDESDTGPTRRPSLVKKQANSPKKQQNEKAVAPKTSQAKAGSDSDTDSDSSSDSDSGSDSDSDREASSPKKTKSIFSYKRKKYSSLQKIDTYGMYFCLLVTLSMLLTTIFSDSLPMVFIGNLIIFICLYVAQKRFFLSKKKYHTKTNLLYCSIYVFFNTIFYLIIHFTKKMNNKWILQIMFSLFSLLSIPYLFLIRARK